MGSSERRTKAAAFLEFRSTSAGKTGRLPKNWLKKLSPISLLLMLVTSSAFAAAVAPTGRGKMQFSTERKQEFENSVTQSSSESTAASSINDLTVTATGHICSKKQRLEISTESACNRLWRPQNATQELLKAAETHRRQVDEYCEGDVIPDCHPVPTVLHISRMCNSTPANIQNYDRLKTVVMRCPKLPCCRVTQSCSAKTSVEFQVTFKALYRGEKTDMLLPTILTIPLRNDTECECRETPTKCPKPFRTTKDGCNCNHKSTAAREKCEQIEDGRKPLNATERRCVEKNKCRLPACSTNLDYDTRTGRCVPACGS